MARILIIDDDEDVHEILFRILDRGGHETDAAATGEEGLRKVDGGGFDLVLADIFLPTKSGLEVIQDLRREHPRVKVVAMTAFGARDDVDMRTFSERYGAVGFIEKPFDHQLVLDTVARVLAAP